MKTETVELIQNILSSGNEDFKIFLISILDENAKLRDALEDYGRHNSGCSAEFGEEYRCRCGWRETAKALGITEGPVK